MSSVLRWSSAQVDAERAQAAEREREAAQATRKVAVCPTRVPEPHELGEFPMTCYSCHVHADS
jgi:hypothetical protein